MQIRTILYQYIKTLIKHVFLLNFTYELLMRNCCINPHMISENISNIYKKFLNNVHVADLRGTFITDYW